MDISQNLRYCYSNCKIFPFLCRSTTRVHGPWGCDDSPRLGKRTLGWGHEKPEDPHPKMAQAPGPRWQRKPVFPWATRGRRQSFPQGELQPPNARSRGGETQTQLKFLHPGTEIEIDICYCQSCSPPAAELRTSKQLCQFWQPTLPCWLRASLDRMDCLWHQH